MVTVCVKLEKDVVKELVSLKTEVGDTYSSVIRELLRKCK